MKQNSLSKRKNLVCLLLVTIAMLSAFNATTEVINAASTPPILSIVPAGTNGAADGTTTIIPAKDVGSTFSVDVRVDNYANVNIGNSQNGVNAASYNVLWDPAVLQYVSKTDGSWLPSQSNTGDLTLNVTIGQLQIGQVAFDFGNANATAAYTSGSISCTINFRVLTTGSTALTLTTTGASVGYLSAPQTNVQGVTQGHPVPGTIIVNAQYGSQVNPNPSVHSPTAIFTPIDESTFPLGSSITLNATLSQPGNDVQICNITNYIWRVEFLNGTLLTSLTGSLATFTPSVLQSLRITLLVIAPDVNSSPSQSYVNTASSSAIINFVGNAQSVTVDVFTDKGGVGKATSGGTYGPLQTAQLYSSITFNGTHLVGQRVTFNILSANGTNYVRQGVTNETGIATVSFRIPASNFSSSQTGLGSWSITAVSDLFGETINDTTSLTVAYINSIQSSSIILPASVHRNQTLPIRLTVINQELSDQITQLTITLMDSAGIPIGSLTMPVTQKTQNANANVTITIPTWAFTGSATAYLCLMSNSSIPLTPQSTVSFNILS